MRLPKHIGIIPDGNRRWALKNNLNKEDGYRNGITPGMTVYQMCKELGVEEITFYGFTIDNTKRPMQQRIAFTNACIHAVEKLSQEDARLFVLGNCDSKMFPKELIPYTVPHVFGTGSIKVNFLVNYSWEWDFGFQKGKLGSQLQSWDVSRMDLIIRWGGCRRLSGFLPIQSVYSDFYVVDAYWPDFEPQQIYDALEWYSKQDVTLGG
ncbi:MAG: undecaprenyl diphosphate synthase family protein [Lachnospiraceae bacterium]